PTKLFSKKETPLTHTVIPMFEDLEPALTKIKSDTEMPNIIRVAAHAASLVLDKYHSLSDECEVYPVAIVMCPDKKLQWFVKRGWKTEDIEDIRRMVIRRWEMTY
ncbi:hypothetical protein B0H17DRAFT_902313, partial [Mycena rosella]